MRLDRSVWVLGLGSVLPGLYIESPNLVIIDSSIDDRGKWAPNSDDEMLT